VLTVYNKKGGQRFTEEDQRLLAIIAGQSAQVIENARLSEEELRMREQMRLAAKIQLDLLPKAAPQIAGYDIAGKSLPAQTVGGDYFDFIAVDQNRLAVCLGDVSGKGLPASLLMANLQATVRAQALVEATAHVCVERSNRLICQNTDRCNFITFFYALLNHRDHRFSYANAGHNPPLLFAGKTKRELSRRGLVLGIRDNLEYEEETVDLQAGDLLLIYSDGVIEAMNARQEEFGEDGLIATTRQNCEDTAGVLIEKIMQALRKHVGQAVQSDDITLVVVKRNGEA
jgi:sigma-B regulation protein RsbU (phosphoserine phosphatase)